MAARKRFSELPFLGDLDIRHARDELPVPEGMLSLITPEHVSRAVGLVTSGVTIPLNLPLDAFDPPLFGRAPLHHEVLRPNRNEAEDVLSGFNPQGSTQLDGLGHIRAREYGFFDGSTDLEEARQTLGVHHLAERGIAGRAVLLDMTVIEPTPFQGRSFSVEEVRAVADTQKVELREGDILLVNTGVISAYFAAEPRKPLETWVGLEGSVQMAEFLWDTGVALVGSDNPSIEPNPGNPKHGFLHRRTLPALGLTFFELLDLRRLVAEARVSAKWEFFFVAVPLNLRGGVSSTANAMVLL